MRVVRSKLPVFFHRRLLLIVVAGVGVSLLLGAKLVQLTVFEGAELRAAAERAIQRKRYLPTWRGSIIDRNGVVLAEDRASWDLALPFEVISDRWAKKQAMLRAQSEFGPEQWGMLSPERQGKEIIDRTGPWNDLIEELYEVIARNTPPDREELDSRVESVRRSISRMVASVQTRQRARFEAKHLDRSGSVRGTFVRRPVAEEFQSHVIVTGLDDPTAFEVRRLARELEQKAAKLHGREELGKPIVELVDGRVRSLPETSRIVTVDRSHLPRPLRSDEPAMLLLTGIGDHVIGRVRERVREEDIRRRPFLNPANQGGIDLGGYRGGVDMIGSSGIEAAFEDELRGRRGIQHSNLETGEVKRQDQMPGNDVQLTIDITLQAHLQALLDPRLGLTRVHQFHAGWRSGVPISKGLPLGTPLDGSIVVLEVESGEILAMVSSPTFAEGGAMDRAARTTHAPFVHRAAEATYPPGSIVKPLVYVSAVSTGAIPIDKEIECVGHLLPDKTDSLRCWIYKMYNGTHGLLGASEAIKNSCNIYFYTLGQVMGLDRLTSWYRKWGLDEYLDTGLRYEREVRVDGDGEEVQWRVRTYGESTGFVPHYADIASQRRSGESIMLGIGQGLVTWTPLQAANAYATLARGGRIRDASLLREEALRSGRRAGTMHLDPEACLRALDGLHRVVNDRDGTGYSIRYADSRDQTFVIPGARVWGKTGTASAPPLRIDVDGDGVFSREGPDQRIKGLDHAWFVGLAGDELEQRPRYAIAVLVEYGGSGGRVAGPIAAEVIRVLTVHGYLGGGSS